MTELSAAKLAGLREIAESGESGAFISESVQKDYEVAI